MATPRQQRAIAIYVENRGEVSVGESMRRAGYSDASAKNPSNLTKSMDWQDAMEHFLPDDKLLGVHVSLLEAKKLASTEFPTWLGVDAIRDMIAEQGGTVRNYELNPITQMTAVWYWIPDVMAQRAALDLAYKLKGKMTQKVEHSGAVDGLFGTDALTITVVDAEHNVQP